MDKARAFNHFARATRRTGRSGDDTQAFGDFAILGGIDHRLHIGRAERWHIAVLVGADRDIDREGLVGERASLFDIAAQLGRTRSRFFADAGNADGAEPAGVRHSSRERHGFVGAEPFLHDRMGDAEQCSKAGGNARHDLNVAHSETGARSLTRVFSMALVSS